LRRPWIPSRAGQPSCGATVPVGRMFIVADEEDAQEATRRFSAPGLDSGTRLSFLAESRIRPSAMKLQPSSGNWIANFRLFRRGPMARSITASEG
jgi:hypothetical protein